MKSTLIFAISLALTGCSGAPKTDPAADKEAISKLRDNFTAAFNAGDSTKIGAMYSEKARVYNNNQPTAEGRAAIVEQNKVLFDQSTTKISIDSHNTVVSGDLAYDEGTVSMQATPKAAGSKPVTEEGRYLVVLKREADGWKVIEDIGNSSMPPAPPPTAKAKAPAKASAKSSTKTKTTAKASAKGR